MKESILTGIRDQQYISRKSNKMLKKQQIEEEGVKRDAIARIMLNQLESDKKLSDDPAQTITQI
jgi:predicted methyltransferase MtxX (methanogen marker protein 4)